MFLIDVSDRANPRYTNLTAAIEASGAAGQGASLTSAFATCGPLIR